MRNPEKKSRIKMERREDLIQGTIRSIAAIGYSDATINTICEAAGLSPAVLAPVLKTVGIAILTHISAEVCRAAKERGIAAFVETAGAAVALCVALPLLRAVLDTVTGLL